MAVHFETFRGVEALDKELWNRLAQGASPIMEWEYFYSLEKSGSVCTERGYHPCHLVAYLDQAPIAIAPLYERDRAWVEFGDGGLVEFLSELTGLPFQHGLVGTIPFTPVPGYQFLHRSDVDSLKAYKLLLDYIDYMCESRGLSTSRIYFVSPASSHLHSLLYRQGYVSLRSQHFVWYNRDYRSFDDYLMSLKTSRRTKIRRELRAIDEQGIQVHMVEGTEAPETYYQTMYQLYLRTWTKHMGFHISPFLNEGFFQLLFEHFRTRTSFSVASRLNEKIAMALFYHKSNGLYGRYWGCFQEVPFLHFATCYYYPIQYAIQRSIDFMDPGFGGEHKLIRGYEEVPVYHYIKFYGEQNNRVARSVLEQVRLRQGNLDPRR
jgi:uncharacterized protein